jgi:glycosyltransferase involved in cell wall biosynthesis
MRLLVLNYEYPPLGGGAGNATYYLCKEWEKMGNSVDIVTTWFSGHEAVHNESEAITIYRVKSRRKKAEQSNPLEMFSYMMRGYVCARNLCKQSSFDLIIGFFSIPSGYIAHRLFRLFGIPYIILLRGGDVPGFLPGQLWFFHWMTMPLTKKIWRSAKRVIANSRGLKSLAEQTGKRIGTPIEFVPNGVDADFYCPGAPRLRTAPTFLFVGRFSPQKNLISMLEQFEASVARKGARLMLVGGGPQQSSIDKTISRSAVLSAAVVCMPWCSKEKLRDHYRQAYCFVNPSLYEGLPNTLLEAMACGLPIIATDIGGNNELVEDGANGFLFKVSDPRGLGKCMQEMMAVPSPETFGNRSRERVLKEFSWVSAAAKIMEG